MNLRIGFAPVSSQWSEPTPDKIDCPGSTFVDATWSPEISAKSLVLSLLSVALAYFGRRYQDARISQHVCESESSRSVRR